MVCILPGVIGAVVAASAKGVDTAAGTWVVAEIDAVGVGFAAGVFDPLSVQPATTIEAMSNAARPRITNTGERFFPFMVFTMIINRGKYTLFR
jgi:hypothetical protein